jgi:predicted dehydrogenase
MNNPLRVGIIGGGFMGRVHSQAARSAGADLVGVASSSSESAENAATQFGISKAYKSAEELLADPTIDVVHICTPNSSHVSLSLAALNAGKHVICEKPLATSVADAQDLVDVAKAKGLVATVYRFHPLVREARDRVATGKVGRVISVRGTYLQDWLLDANDNNWRVDASAGGASRAFGDIGSHLVDLMEFVTGERISALNAVTNIAHPVRGGNQVTTEDEAVLLFKSENGVIGTLMVSQVAAGRKNRLLLDVAGTIESIEFNQEHPETIWLGRRSGSVVLPRDESQNSDAANKYSTVPSGHPMGYVDAFAAFVGDTYKAISGAKTGNSVVDGLPTFADGLRSANVIKAVLESAATGQWVNL